MNSLAFYFILNYTHTPDRIAINAPSGKGYGKALFTATGQTAFTTAHGLGTTQSFIIPASAAICTGSVASKAAGDY